MGLERNYTCDACGKVLQGRKGLAEVHETYLSIKGSMTLQRWDDVTHKPDFIYLSESQFEPMCFCNTMCIKAFAEAKIDIHDKQDIKASNYERAQELHKKYVDPEGYKKGMPSYSKYDK
jgi:hypothetical protein